MKGLKAFRLVCKQFVFSYIQASHNLRLPIRPEIPDAANGHAKFVG